MNIVRINIGLPVINKIPFKYLTIPTQKLLIKILLIEGFHEMQSNVSDCIGNVLLYP